MPKVYFHNEKSIDQNINTKRLSEAQHISERQVVDINKLLNRVKIDQKNETKRKVIFYSVIILGLSLLGTLIAFLK
ncbi:Miff domain-containing protein [Candidatus Pelagibacter sp.]|nr:Miff domain-containing protein [Candidatus Pelagibacter sp.]MDC1483726.1 Miff domain-containing protein [Pelagibacteraceae bacterium]